MRRFAFALLIVTILGGTAEGQVAGQVNSRKIKPAEQALFDRLAAEFAKIIPAVPAGWTEVERRVFDPGGMVSDWDAPHQADYEVQLVVNDLSERQKKVEDRQQAAVDAGRGRLDAASDNNAKMMEEYASKLQAAIEKNDQAAVKRLQEEFEKKMAAGAKAAAAPVVAAPELSDSYARIRIHINPYNAPGLASEKRLPTPTGFVAASRREPDESNAEREGVNRYLLGNWKPGENGDYTLKFTPGRQSVVYGIVVEIEARADRAEALFKALSKVRLQTLLQ